VSAEVTVVSGIAERYATALFDLARDGGAIDQVADDIAAIAAMIDESDDLSRLIRSPVLGYEDQAKGLGAVLAKAGIGDLTSKFVGVVAQNRRLFALRDMCRAYRALLAAHRGEVVATVTTAHSLNDRQLADIKAELGAAMKTDVSLESKVDESILGGMIVRVGSRMVDSSLRTKLQNLKFAMRGGE
jgi:F-type H+-transporting ATPase subunit delta